MFSDKEKNNIFMKLSMTEEELRLKIDKDQVRVYSNANEALFKAYDIHKGKIKGNDNSKQLILNLLQLEEIQCLGLDSNLTLADAFVAFHPNTCRASDEKFVVFLDDNLKEA